MFPSKNSKPVARLRFGVLVQVCALTCVLVGIFISVRLFSASRPAPLPGPTPKPLHVMAWDGNSPDADRALGFSGVRQGCSDPPQSCMHVADSETHRGLKVFLSVLLKPETAAYGAEYSELSRKNPMVEEIGIDDFVSQYERLWQAKGSGAPAVLDSMITGVKSRNPNLHFGITLYGDELQRDRDYLTDPKLPASIRGEVDYVHFFLHYRADSPKYADDLSQAKSIFPNAQMIAGVYSYDRISYLPCAPKGNPCSVQEEMNGFEEQLDSAVNLLKSGAVSWIEFFPGFFGREGQWPDWKETRICAPERRTACMDNTKQMHAVVADKLKQLEN